MAKSVKIYDLADNKISTIPAAELAPNMVEADVVGVGRVWISDKDIFGGKIKYAPFTEAKRQLFRQLKSALDEVYPKTLEAWEETFRKDSDPEQEIAIWLHIASTYQQSTAGKKLTLPQRKEYLMAILCCTRSPREHIFEIFRPEIISRQEAEQVIELYHSK